MPLGRESQISTNYRAISGQRLWQSKHDMEIGHRQKIGLTFLQPLGSGQGLALGTMAVQIGRAHV